jgi:predicted NUDIX family NTP pyrophosphohydrolase
MSTESAGLILYRFRDGSLEVLLVHPGGPFWQRRDDGAWSIPKGESSAGEALLAAARREFEEELGAAAPDAQYASLGSLKQAGGKIVHAWAAPSDFDVDRLRSNTFEMEWPPRSGRVQRFPEVDRAAWFRVEESRRKLLPSQLAFIDRLSEMLGTGTGAGPGQKSPQP